MYTKLLVKFKKQIKCDMFYDIQYHVSRNIRFYLVVAKFTRLALIGSHSNTT